MTLPVLLLREWSGEDPTGWWASPKLDGVRALFDGHRLWSRSGRAIPAPAWFTAGLPAGELLDGELYCGPGTLRMMLSNYVRGETADWRGVRFCIFDRPVVGPPVEDRLASLRGLTLPPHAGLVPHTRIEGECHLLDCLDQIERAGGEGVVIRRPGAKYENGRSWAALKYRLPSAHLAGHEDQT